MHAAIRTLRRRLTLDCLILLCLTGIARPGSAAQWLDTRAAGPFLCHADFPLAGLDGLFAELAQLQQELVHTLGIPPASERIDLYLFHDQSTYRAYLSRYLPDVPYRRALYVKLQGPGMVFAYRSQELDIDLRHECTHALLHAVLPMVPLWLDEGLAEYFEVSPNQRAFDNPHLSSVRWGARFGFTPNLANLEKKGTLADMGKSEYRSAWAWTHFMLHGSPEAHEELVRYLADIQAGTPPGQLGQRLEQRLPQLSRRIAGHFKAWSR